MLRFPLSLTRALSVALLVAMCAFATPAIAAPAPATSLADAQAQATAARSKLAEMRRGLDAGMSAFNSASNDLSATQDRIARSKRELARVQASLQSGQKSLSGQAQFLYRTDGTGFLDVLLGSATFDQFAARLAVLQTIASKDAATVVQLKADRAEQTRILAELKQREASQKALVAKVGAQRDSVQEGLDRQQAYLSSLNGQVQALVAAQEKAAQASASRASATQASNTPDSGRGVGSGPAADSAPPSQSGKVALKLASVSGRPGSWWVMADEASAYRPTGVTFSGEASVYGVADNGTGTSSGRRLNDNELTCAHPSLAFGTRIAVTHGSKRVIVVVTDRGPYSGGRVIDLTHRAAALLGVDGVGQVKCEVVRGQ